MTSKLYYKSISSSEKLTCYSHLGSTNLLALLYLWVSLIIYLVMINFVSLDDIQDSTFISLLNWGKNQTLNSWMSKLRAHYWFWKHDFCTLIIFPKHNFSYITFCTQIIFWKHNFSINTFYTKIEVQLLSFQPMTEPGSFLKGDSEYIFV